MDFREYPLSTSFISPLKEFADDQAQSHGDNLVQYPHAQKQCAEKRVNAVVVLASVWNKKVMGSIFYE